MENNDAATDKLDSSSGDEESECCAICLGKLTSKKLPSKPDSGCDHWFCRECLVEWSKQVRFSSLIPIIIFRKKKSWKDLSEINGENF